MNRRKKIKSILTKKNKQANLKANPKKAKPKYISKAEREKMEAAESSELTTATPPLEEATDQQN